MAGDDPTTVEFGARTYKLEPQRTGRIFKRLGVVRKALAQTGSEGVTEGFREALEVFIPDIAPLWELAGYPSPEAYDKKLAHDQEVAKARDAFAIERGEENWDAVDPVVANEFELPPELEEWDDPYDEALDRSPTGPQIGDVIQAIYNVNGGKRLERLIGNLVDPQMLKAMVRTEYVNWVNRRAMKEVLQQEQRQLTSPSSSPPSGESASTSSGQPEPTSPDATPTDSPSNGSGTDSVADLFADRPTSEASQ